MKDTVLSASTPSPVTFSTRIGIRPSSKWAQEKAEIEDVLQESKPVEYYVRHAWPQMRRSMRNLYLGACIDPKMPSADNTYTLYVPHEENLRRIQRERTRARASAAKKLSLGTATLPEGETEMPTIRIEKLPPRGSWHLPPEEGGLHFKQHGLLYVPHPYIVPGPRFNEMYNWDSMFIAGGLITEKRYDDAKWIVDNLLYESEHYGTVLNGNRTYYMNGAKGRSQPPLVAEAILPIADKWDKLRRAEGQTLTGWLKQSAESLEKYYRHWITPPHLDAESGLSRYASNKGTPSAEVLSSEKDHYEGALALFTRLHANPKTAQERYYADQALTVGADGKTLELSPAFFKGDDAMRESGFDPCGRFGPYNADIGNHLPVCLNMLRLKMEKDMAGIYRRLAAEEPAQADKWNADGERWNATARRTEAAVQKHLWDDGMENGVRARMPLFRDRNTNPALKEYELSPFRDYPFATALYPLYAGAASDEQAGRILDYIKEKKLITPFGLRSSDQEDSGCQWDNKIWGNLNKIGFQACANHYEKTGNREFAEAAVAIGAGFLRTVSRDFAATGELYEKYETKKGTSKIEDVDKGYGWENVKGFGWTNSTILDLRAGLKRLREKLRTEEREQQQEARIVRSAMSLEKALERAGGVRKKGPLTERAGELGSTPSGARGH